MLMRHLNKSGMKNYRRVSQFQQEQVYRLELSNFQQLPTLDIMLNKKNIVSLNLKLKLMLSKHLYDHCNWRQFISILTSIKNKDSKNTVRSLSLRYK